ncbi:uncharacterized protein dpr10 isoform X4 [Drosophila takahashii]|uniref:uncharacterized protein dpr10 isoform X4 n=1 Tax=Drosophila takahashii TaxID=29030 RepID=UPI00389924DF
MLTLWTALFCCLTGLAVCYQRQSVSNNNHNNAEAKPTHAPPSHYPHGHKWNEPYFDLTMPRNITSLVGKSAYLGCRVKHLGNKTVAWIRHRDLHILTVGTYTYTTDQRFQTSYHRDIDEWTLQIKWAQQRDAGVYECQISTQPVRSYSVNLNIVDLIDAETSDMMQQYYNDDAFYIAENRVYQSSNDEFAGMFGPIQTVADRQKIRCQTEMRGLLEGCHACILFFNILQHFPCQLRRGQGWKEERSFEGCGVKCCAPEASTFLAHDEQIAFQQAFTH